ncbi:MAG: acetyl-CoA carboxylase biotin carboxyl carrier protein [Planctomyces sp.]|nr:acetyl-CoA carboxylase biotin carboxyl carrier protein [Planctomyces sp.]
MAKPNETEDKGGSFDLERFRKLLQLMEKYGVTEANLQNDQESWKVRRGPRQVAYAPETVTFSQPMAAAPVAAAAAPVVASAPAERPPGVTINAPTVGTFYSAASPDDEAFVAIGSTVKPDTVVCIIEAMKVFNQIQAEKSGRIVEILVENGAAVEFGQPMFRIEPA